MSIFPLFFCNYYLEKEGFESQMLKTSRTLNVEDIKEYYQLKYKILFVKILLLKFVAKEIKKFMHLEELFTDLLRVVYKVAQLPIQVLNIDTRIQHFFEKFKAQHVRGVNV